jgi:hypothetical protein
MLTLKIVFDVVTGGRINARRENIDAAGLQQAVMAAKGASESGSIQAVRVFVFDDRGGETLYEFVKGRLIVDVDDMALDYAEGEGELGLLC